MHLTHNPIPEVMIMKRFFAVVLCCIMSITSPIVSHAADAAYEGTAVVYDNRYESYAAIQSLKDMVDLDYFKTFIMNGTSVCSTSIDISSFNIRYSSENMALLSQFIYNEIPENFHLNSRISYSYKFGKITKVNPTYSYDVSEYQRMLSEMEEAKENLLRGIKDNASLGEVEKALLIHDRLALLCEYDYTGTDNRYNSYGALVSGIAVCQGYTEAYDYLLEEVGIESYFCSSDKLNHAWNIVYINNIPYHVDVTWDDPSWEVGEDGVIGAVRHENFLRSTSGIYSSGHEADDFDSFPDDTTYDNYFWQNSEASFRLINNELYYIDNDSEELKRYSDGTVLCSVSYEWRDEYGYWSNNARLSDNGTDLLFSSANAIYRFDLVMNAKTKIYEPSLSGYNSIYGFDYSDGYLICDINKAPPYSGNTENVFRISALYHPVLYGDVNGNGTVGLSDATVLMQYISDWDVSINTEAADINRDGRITLRDITLLLRYIAGWDVIC